MNAEVSLEMVIPAEQKMSLNFHAKGCLAFCFSRLQANNVALPLDHTELPTSIIDRVVPRQDSPRPYGQFSHSFLRTLGDSIQNIEKMP